MKKVIITLLAFGALSTAAIPAHADSVTVLDSVQTSDTAGDYNATSQDSIQQVRNRGRDTHDSTGTSARSDQLSVTTGHGNVTDQDSTQQVDNTSIRNNRPARTYRQ